MKIFNLIFIAINYLGRGRGGGVSIAAWENVHTGNQMNKFQFLRFTRPFHYANNMTNYIIIAANYFPITFKEIFLRLQ